LNTNIEVQLAACNGLAEITIHGGDSNGEEDKPLVKENKPTLGKITTLLRNTDKTSYLIKVRPLLTPGDSTDLNFLIKYRQFKGDPKLGSFILQNDGRITYERKETNKLSLNWGKVYVDKVSKIEPVEDVKYSVYVSEP
jgi:hypothetical protein